MARPIPARAAVCALGLLLVGVPLPAAPAAAVSAPMVTFITGGVRVDWAGEPGRDYAVSVEEDAAGGGVGEIFHCYTWAPMPPVCAVTGLLPRTVYTVSVTDYDTGDYSTTWVRTPGAPSAPSGLSAMVVGEDGANRVVEFGWPAAGDGGTPVTGYRFTVDGAAYTDTALTRRLPLSPGRHTATVEAITAWGTSPARSLTFTVPGVPALNPTVSDARGTRPTVNWSAYDVGGATYDVTVVSGPRGTVATCPPTTALSCTLPRLADDTYTVTVHAGGAYGVAGTTASTTITVARTAPSAPTAVTATRTGPASRDGGPVTVTWQPPADDGGDPILGYRVVFSHPGNRIEFNTPAGERTVPEVILLAGLVTVTVSARNALGYSPEATDTVTVPIAPDSPSSSRSYPSGDGEVTVEWIAPSTGPTPEEYRVDVTDTSIPGGAVGWVIRPGSTRSFTAPGLTVGHVYEFAVTSLTAGAESTPVMTRTTVEGRPGAPQDLSTSFGTRTRGATTVPLTVTWGAPADTDVHTPVLHYTVVIGSTVHTVDAGTPTFTVDVPVGGAIPIWVAAQNRWGEGARAYATVVSPDLLPVEVPSAPRAIIVTRTGDRITIRWSSPADDGGDSDLTYLAIASANGGLGEPCPVPDGALTCTMVLPRGADYRVEVFASNSAGNSRPGIADVTIPDVPAAPTGVDATVTGSGQVTLTWADPTDDGGAPITGYRVTVGSSAPIDLPASATQHTLSGLPPGPATFTVAAVNEMGDGAPAGITARVPGAPGAPTGLAAQRLLGGLHLTWDAPTDDGGSPITGYRLTVGSTAPIDLPAGRTEHTITGLDRSRDYPIDVATLTAFEQSAAVTATATTGGGPASPLGVTTTAAGPGAVTVSWQPPADDGGTPIVGYTITGPGGLVVDVPADSHSVTLTGLTPGLASLAVATRTGWATSSATVVMTGVPSPVSSTPVTSTPVPAGQVTTTPQAGPSRITATATGSRAVTVTVTPRAPDTRYTVRLQRRTGARWATVRTGHTRERTRVITFPGLPAGRYRAVLPGQPDRARAISGSVLVTTARITVSPIRAGAATVAYRMPVGISTPGLRLTVHRRGDGTGSWRLVGRFPLWPHSRGTTGNTVALTDPGWYRVTLTTASGVPVTSPGTSFRVR